MEPAARQLSLRLKTLALVAITTVCLVAALYLPLRSLILDSFLRLENDVALSDLTRAKNAIDFDFLQLQTTTGDYAVWDDTYAYMEDRSERFTDVNFVDATFVNNRLGLVALVDPRGRVLFSKGYDLARQRARAVPPDLASIVRRVCPRGRCGNRFGLVETREGPYMLATRFVTDSSGEAASRGSLLMGRPLDDAAIARLAQAVGLSISLAPVRSSHRLGLAQTERVVPLDEQRMEAHRLLVDIGERPYLALTVSARREIYEHGVFGTRSLGIALTLAGLVFGLVILLSIDRVVLRRLARLSADVERVSASPDATLRVSVDGNDELAGLGRGINGMLGELAQARQVLRSALGRYVSEDVARAVLAHPEGAALGGETREVTILFSDIRGYSTISERMPPAEVVELLNEYFGAISEVIEARGGVVIEFLGDAVLAVFGAPNPLPDHAERAVRTALDIGLRGEELNRGWDASGRSEVWKTHGLSALTSRIGMHTGRVVAGNLGSKTRMKYAVIGDVVNTAARIEALNEVVGTDILLTEEVRAALPPELAKRAKDHGEHVVKGRKGRVHVYTIEAGE
jgi:class 3 adenylate cyclase/sensor domain CHASE-containing protein